MCYRLQHLPPEHRWMELLLDYMEDHLRDDSEVGRDIWNRR